jgi:TetR/AcrR family transcriptional regulator, transcriptional repressor for nem operon
MRRGQIRLREEAPFKATSTGRWRYWGIDYARPSGHLTGMPRPSNPDVRRRLIEGGLILIGKQGFAGSGVAEITASAGVPKGSFYQYFESKQSYAIELLDDYWARIEAEHTQILRDERYTPLDRIARHFRSIGQDHKQQKFALGCLIGNLGIEMADAGDSAQTKLRQIVRRWASLLSDCLQQAQAVNQLDRKEDVQELAAALIDAWEGAVMRAKIERSGAAYKRFQTVVLPRLLG